MDIKNVGFTYKSQILKLKIQQKFYTKKDVDRYVKMLNFFVSTKNHLGCFLM